MLREAESLSNNWFSEFFQPQTRVSLKEEPTQPHQQHKEEEVVVAVLPTKPLKLETIDDEIIDTAVMKTPDAIY